MEKFNTEPFQKLVVNGTVFKKSILRMFEELIRFEFLLKTEKFEKFPFSMIRLKKFKTNLSVFANHENLLSFPYSFILLLSLYQL